MVQQCSPEAFAEHNSGLYHHIATASPEVAFTRSIEALPRDLILE